MSKEFLAKLECKKEVCRRWKQRHVTQEEYRVAVQSYRDGVRKAKAHLKLNLWKDVKGNNKGIYKYINSKIMTRENLYLLLDGQQSW